MCLGSFGFRGFRVEDLGIDIQGQGFVFRGWQGERKFRA